jgi:hypothetical protein
MKINHTSQPTMWACTPADETPNPLEVEEIKRKYSWRTLLTAPWHCVETWLWGEAATDEKYIQEVPVVLAEVEEARRSTLKLA